MVSFCGIFQRRADRITIIFFFVGRFCYFVLCALCVCVCLCTSNVPITVVQLANKAKMEFPRIEKKCGKRKWSAISVRDDDNNNDSVKTVKEKSLCENRWTWNKNEREKWTISIGFSMATRNIFLGELRNHTCAIEKSKRKEKKKKRKYKDWLQIPIQSNNILKLMLITGGNSDNNEANQCIPFFIILAHRL